MGAFELNSANGNVSVAERSGGCFQGGGTDCIMALKVYDQCRSQTCLDADEIGAARIAYGECEGKIVSVPHDAVSVNVENVRIKKITVVDKEQNDFRAGYWDVELQYLFEYTLIFNKANGDEKCCVKAKSLYNRKVTLFGSVSEDVVLATDLFGDLSTTLDADPIVVVSGKAIGLSAKIGCARRCGGFAEEATLGEDLEGASAIGRREAFVTIGLFTIIKLCRLVDLSVETRGFCIADEMEDEDELTPCEFFNNLNFPFEVFSPPRRNEFGPNCHQTRGGAGDRNKKKCSCHE